MSEHELSILLSLRDEASKQIEGFSQKVASEMDRAGDAMVSMGRQLNTVSRNMAFLGTAIVGPLALAFKTASNYSIDVNNSLTRLGDSTIALQNTIATAMIPVVDKLNEYIWGAVKAFQNLDPAMRNTIIQGALVSGIFLLIGSGLLKAISAIEILVGKLLIFTAAGISLNLVAIAIIAIAAATIAIVLAWDQVKSVVLPILNAFEFGINVIALAWTGLAALIWEGAYQITNALSVILDVLSKIPGPQQEMFRMMATGTREAATYYDQMSKECVASIDAINQEQQNLIDNFSKGNGALSSTVDKIITKINELRKGLGNLASGDSGLQNFGQNFQKTFTQAYEAAKNLGAQSAQIFTSSISTFSTGFGNAVANMLVKGQNFGASMKEVFSSLATTFISSIIAMIAQLVIYQAITIAFWPLIATLAGVSASALAEIWAPVAALVSLATMGGNAVPAMAAIAATTAFAQSSGGISGLAGGGTLISPGSVIVGERGPEILNLPRGASVIPLDRTRGNTYGGNTYVTNINFDFDKVTIRDERDINLLAEKVSRIFSREIDRIR